MGDVSRANGGSAEDELLVLSVDQGTSATKAILVDHAGRVVGRASVPLEQAHPAAGRAEQDPNEIWRSVVTAVTEVVSSVDACRIEGLGLSTQRESTVLWERETGRALDSVLGWQDTRGSGLCDRLRAEGHAERISATTGLPLDPMFSASKASWLLDRHDPDRIRSRAGELCVGTVDSWLLWNLGSGHVVEVGNASRTQLLDVHSGQWDPWLLDQFGVPAQVLPTVLPSDGPFSGGFPLPGLPAPVPIGGVLGDSHAALFAHAAWDGTGVKVTYGTGSSVMGIASGAGPAPAGIARTIAWQLGAHTSHAAEGNIRSTGATLVWLASLFGVTPSQIADSAASDSGGVFLVPAFTGLGAPWWDDRARAIIAGVDAGTTREHIARAGLESIVLQIEDVIVAAEAGGSPVAAILADGGPSANPVLMQLQADTSGRVVHASNVAELSALGAAHLAGIGIGVWTVDEVLALPRHRRTYHPSTTDTERTVKRNAWHRAVAAARATGPQEGQS